MKMKYCLRLFVLMLWTFCVFIESNCKKVEDPFLIDIDGNIYNTVTIGKQVWMGANLKTSRLNDGTQIYNITPNDFWASNSFNWQPFYCWYNNDSTNKDVYGALYNWHAVETGKLCPKGWHVPSSSEWITLITYLGDKIAGGKLKESGTLHWLSPNQGADNSSGFTAVPGGERFWSGQFAYIGNSCHLWSTTEEMAGTGMGAVDITLYSLVGGVLKQAEAKENGFSVRCIKDN